MSTALALFSGGLDSILAARLVQDQGISVHCIHFVSPFFGRPQCIPHWEKAYHLSIEAVDIGDDYVSLLQHRPTHGFGKVMNPCVDCKILMMRRAEAIRQERNAAFLISGEVMGQRPMSQRRDTLNIILRDANVRDMLLRPLSALHLEPISAEREGVVDRSRLLSFSGRGRRNQLELAQKMGISEIPTPAGGCRLAEKENARRYWPVLTNIPSPSAADFELANIGRQFWAEDLWLVLGRNAADNLALEQVRQAGDILFYLRDFTGPLGLARPYADEWPRDAVRDAAALVASYSPKAMSHAASPNATAAVLVDMPGQGKSLLHITPTRQTSLAWGIPDFQTVREAMRTEHSTAGRE